MSETLIHLSDDVALPLDLVTESNAILGKKGSGKTSAAIVLLEEMFRAGVPVVSIDPKGDHFGIRSSADGAAEGLPIPVFGGLHGDIPLEPTAGALIADLVLERRLSCVLDVSEFSRADVRRFLLAFGDRLYRKAKREPMHLFLEECHEYLPQQVRAEDAALVGAWQRVVKMGRFKGVGVTLLSQRSAAVNKDVLEQVDNLFVMRTTGPRDRDAIKGWIDTHADSKGILASLPSMASGECWLWQPGRGEPINFRFRMRDTYDAGATPKIGEKPKPPATLADVDLTAISDAMADTIEKAKADDPKELRARIATLTKDLQAAQRTTAPEPVIVEKEIIVEKTVVGLNNKQRSALDTLVQKLSEFVATLDATAPETPTAAVTSTPAAPLRTPPPPAPVTAREDGPLHLRTGARRMVESLGRMAPLRLTKSQWGTVAKLKTSGGTWSTYLGEIRRAGLVDENSAGYTLTDAGFEFLGGRPAPMGAAELQDHYRSILRSGAAKMLDALIDTYPQGLDKTELGDAAGIAITGGTFSTYLGDLTRNGLAVRDGAEIRATDILMLGANQ